MAQLSFPESYRIKPKEWAVLLLLCGVGLALRWWRLDLIPFRYDAAEAMARARETLHLGYPPYTGIVNSLGFRNPPGLEWLILPAVLISPDPRWAVALIGIYVMTGVFPLFLTARQLGGHLCAYLVAALYTFLPVTVFASRDVWAQNLLIPLGSWCLLFAVRATRLAREERLSALTIAALFAGVGATVHLAALVWFLGILGWWLTVLVREKRAGGIAAGKWFTGVLIGALISLILLPSAIDWAALRLSPPREKPPHIEKFEAMAPPPKSLAGRLGEAYSGLFDPLSSLQTTSGIEREFSPHERTVAGIIDLVLLAWALLALAWIALAMRRERAPHLPGDSYVPVGYLLLAWLFLPPLLTSIVMSYPNGTYFFFAMPALFLAMGVGLRSFADALTSRQEQYRVFLRRAGAAGAVLLALYYCFFHISAMNCVARCGRVDGPYYIPFGEQLSFLRECVDAGMGRGNLIHLGGPWFQRSYDYLALEVLSIPPRKPAVVMEDILLRTRHPHRQQFIEDHLSRRHGTVYWDIFPTFQDAALFADSFYRLPLQ